MDTVKRTIKGTFWRQAEDCNALQWISAQWDRLSKQLQPLRNADWLVKKTQAGLILGWYFTRGYLEYKLLK